MLLMSLWSVIRQLSSSSSRSIKETLSVDDVDTLCDNEAPPRFDKIISDQYLIRHRMNTLLFVKILFLGKFFPNLMLLKWKSMYVFLQSFLICLEQCIALWLTDRQFRDFLTSIIFTIFGQHNGSSQKLLPAAVAICFTKDCHEALIYWSMSVSVLWSRLMEENLDAIWQRSFISHFISTGGLTIRLVAWQRIITKMNIK